MKLFKVLALTIGMSLSAGVLAGEGDTVKQILDELSVHHPISELKSINVLSSQSISRQVVVGRVTKNQVTIIRTFGVVDRRCSHTIDVVSVCPQGEPCRVGVNKLSQKSRCVAR